LHFKIALTPGPIPPPSSLHRVTIRVSGAPAKLEGNLKMNGFAIRYFAAISLSTLILAAPSIAQKKYDPGVTDTEIKIGTVAPLTGLNRDYAAISLAETAYFQMINDKGGVNGRKINLVIADNESFPGNSADLTHKLVEQDHVFLLFSSFGTESNLSVREYLNQRKIPQLFLNSNSVVFNDPAHFPWTMGFYATFRLEGRVYAKYILENRPDAKIGILYEDDDAGKEYLAGVYDGLGKKASTTIVKELSYGAGDPGIDSQIVALKNSGANVFLNLSIGTFTSASIRKAYDIDWHPLQFIPNASLSIAAFLEPAGLHKAAGVITNARSKGWLYPGAASDPEVAEFLDWMKKYNPQASIRDQNYVAGYERAEALVEVLKKCGDDLTRANVMKQATNLDVEIGMLRPGIKITTGPTDYQPIKQLFLMRFNGQDWESIGPITDN
jgi:branched-chain amino acid transport system substrate-binding protein